MSNAKKFESLEPTLEVRYTRHEAQKRISQLRRETYARIVALLTDEATWGQAPVIAKLEDGSPWIIYRSRPQLLIGVAVPLEEAQHVMYTVDRILQDANNSPVMLSAQDAFGEDFVVPIQYRVKLLESLDPEVEERFSPAYSQYPLSGKEYRNLLENEAQCWRYYIAEAEKEIRTYEEQLRSPLSASERKVREEQLLLSKHILSDSRSGLQENEAAQKAVDMHTKYALLRCTGNAHRIGYIGTGPDGAEHWLQTNVGDACVVVYDPGDTDTMVSFYSRHARPSKPRKKRVYHMTLLPETDGRPRPVDYDIILG